MLRIPDRFWWVQRYGGVLLAVGGLIVVIIVVIGAFTTYSDAHIPGGDPQLAAILRNLALQLLLLGCAYILIAVRGIGFVWASFHSRERYQRRLCALEGDQEAMQRANVRVDRRRTPDLAGESLELLWRATPFTSRIMTTLLAVALVIFGPIDGLFWYLAYCLATNTPPIGSTYIEPMSPLERVGLVAVLVFVAALLLFLVVFLIRLLPWERGRPYGVTACNEGLWCYPRIGKRRLLRWDEVRLLEVSIASEQRYRKYRLYGRDTLAEWFDVPPSKWVSLGMNEGEFEQRHQALLDVIAARTGLVPRTLDKRLVEAGS